MTIALAMCCCMFVKAQDAAPADTVTGPTKWVGVTEQEQKLVFFQGFTLSADVLGPLFYAVSDYGFAEAALRLNLKNTFLPIFELGYGKCENLDYNTGVSFKTSAPYARLGIDYNLLKDKFQSNRLYAGLRYGVSTFSYDVAGPEQTDPIWGGSAPFSFSGIDCTSHWAEIVFGAEVQVYKNFHMGWLIRYKSELSSSKSPYAKPNCIPGYGYTTNSTCWGATYSLIFDLNWGMKKSKKKGVKIEMGDGNSTQSIEVQQTTDGVDVKADKKENDGEGTGKEEK